VRKLQRNLLQLEFDRKILTEEDKTEVEIENLEFEHYKKIAEEEVQINLARLMYRAKYNLPPNDPRFLDMTDEEIIYELILQKEYNKRMAKDEGQVFDANEHKDIFLSDEQQYEDITKRLENGENIDLFSLLKPENSWESVE
jgi:hypothetical protein